ncbi:MAG: hypothetical protein DRP78_04080 [Candidatus Omnitrophota bacterium]|nr:MAG: hypothetical protein DRP78_04080 [Candidatus Omnitrophota bacterium]
MQFCIVLPVHNEEMYILNLINSLQSFNADIIVVDDGSFDNTANLLKKTNAIILTLSKNFGKGRALRTAFNYVLQHSYEWVITMDSDGQHLPQDITLFIECAHKLDADIVIGNRMHSLKTMPLIRKFANISTSKIISFLIGYNIADTQCGFRLISRKVIEKINLSTSNYETESEILFQAALHNFYIKSVPIKTIYTKQKSKISPFIDTIRFCRLIYKTFYSNQLRLSISKNQLYK